MARYTGPDCKRCRREKTKLFLKGSKCESSKCPIEIRPYPPGDTVAVAPRTAIPPADAREAEVRAYLRRAREAVPPLLRGGQRRPGKTGENLLQLLERRLDNVVYRAGFAHSRDMARQLVKHGHFIVNGSKVDIPSSSSTRATSSRCVRARLS